MRETQFVHRLPVTTPTLFPAITTNIYMVEDQAELVVIDAGYDYPEATDSIVSYIHSLGSVRVKGILLTHHHKDHCPGAKKLAVALNCPIFCHPFEVKAIEAQIHPTKITSIIEEGDVLQVGSLSLAILHTPGHTRGHISVWLKQEGLLFTGDNIVGQGTTWIGPPDGDLVDYLATLRRFLKLQPSTIAPGHGEMIQNPTEKIQFFIQRRLQREQQILSLLAEREHSVEDLVQIIYQAQVHPSVMWVAERTIQGHLDKLLKEQQIRTHDNLYFLF